MLQFEDKQLLALWGWNLIEDVYGELPGLAKKLRRFSHMLVNLTTCNEICNVARDYVVATVPDTNYRSLPEFDVWVPPTERGKVYIVVKAPRK